MFSLSGLPSLGELLVLTDQISSPADFLIHQILTTHLKEINGSKCLFLSVSEPLTRLKAIAGKSNLNLPQHIQSGSFHFIDVGTHSDPPVKSETSLDQQPSLKPILELTRQKISTWSETDSNVLVIFDDISALEWIGYPTTDLLRFIRALSALCRKTQTSLLIRHHITTPGEPDDILRLLHQLGAYHLEVLPLSTGRSGSVSGQIALHPGPGITQPIQRPIPRQSAIQYRLTDTNVVFFDRGTGNTVL